jgi:hypothetical protein
MREPHELQRRRRVPQDALVENRAKRAARDHRREKDADKVSVGVVIQLF